MLREDSRPIGYWLKWIKNAKAAAKKSHWPDAKAAYAEYENKRARNEEDSIEHKKIARGYNIYWASSELLASCYYSRPPKIRSRRAHGIDDDMALTMCLIADRLGQFLVDRGSFDEAIRASVADIIHASKAAPQVLYSTETELQRIRLDEAEDSYLIPGTQEVYEGEIEQDDTGIYGFSPKAIEATQRISLAPLPFDEVLHTPRAKHWDEVTEIAFKFCLPKDEAEEIFNPDGKLALPYKVSKVEDDESEDNSNYGMPSDDEWVLEGWEIHCKKTRKRYWVCEDFKDAILKTDDDKWQLEGFFPCTKFVITNKPRKSMYPTPTFVYLEATINQLHLLYARIFKLIDGIRRRAIAIGLPEEVVDLLNSGTELEFLSAGEIGDLLQKGNINQYLQYVDVKELVDAISETMNLEEHFKQNFYEWFGMPDVLRGNSDSNKTAEAVSLESEAAVNRFRVTKRLIVDMAREAAEIMLDLALKVFSDEKIARICGYQYLHPGIPPIPPSPENPQGVPGKLGHKERFFDALNALRNDTERIVRIDFETDATSFRDEAREIERQKLISDTTLQGLATIGGIQNQEFVQIALDMLLAVISTMGGSTQTEDMIRQSVAKLEEMKNQPPAPPPPDYEAMKVEIAAQKVKQQAQSDQINAQIKMREADIKQMQAMLDNQAQAFEERLAAARLQLDQQKQAYDMSLKNYEQALERALVAIEQQRVDIERYSAQANTILAGTEEIRLAKEASTEALAKVNDFFTMKMATKEESAKVQPPPITIVNDIQPQRMAHEFVRDENGNLLKIRPVRE